MSFFRTRTLSRSPQAPRARQRHAPPASATRPRGALRVTLGPIASRTTDKMIKVLESKYNDYGFFIGWEQDSDWRILMQKEMKKTQIKVKKLWRRYAPWGVQRTVYNIWANFEFVVRKVRSLVLPDDKPKRKPRSSGSSSKSSTRR